MTAPQLCLSGKPWSLIRSRDWSLCQSLGATSTTSNLASPQWIDFPAGTSHVSESLTRHLERLGVDEHMSADRLPSVDDLIPSYARHHYEFARDDETWRISIQHPYSATDLTADDWVIIAHIDETIAVFDVSGTDLDSCLAVFPLLDLGISPDDLSQRTANHPKVRDFIVFLVETGLCTLDALFDQDSDAHYRPWEEPGIDRVFSLGHSGLFVASDGGAGGLLIDPVGDPSALQHSWTRDILREMLQGAEAVLLSHNHWDHAHYQTLLRLQRDIAIYVPKVADPTYFNPCLKRYLERFGFTNVRELESWDSFQLGDISVKTAPLIGECFGLGSVFDGIVYHIEVNSRTLLGTVDAYRNERSDMTEVIDVISGWGPLDTLLFGASGQTHPKPWMAGAPHHFSNELQKRPELIQYHASPMDIRPWIETLSPSLLVPYADFSFSVGEAGTGPCEHEIDLPARSCWQDDVEAVAALTEKPLIFPKAYSPI